MDFSTLQRRLLDAARRKVRNGEVTERALAQLAGISQPHLHNALKGIRALSPELADRLLMKLELTIIDLLEPAERAAYQALTAPEPLAQVSFLDGLIGPGYPWPGNFLGKDRLNVPRDLCSGLRRPAVVRLGRDLELHGLVAPGQLALVDIGEPVWEWHSDADSDGHRWYVLALEGGSLVRRIIKRGSELWLAAGAGSQQHGKWRLLSLQEDHLSAAVKARVVVLDLGPVPVESR
jgi:hypothetical protein